MSYEINYEDPKFKEVESDKNKAISDITKTYSGMIDETGGYYQEQIDATKEWEKKQTELQNQQTDFAIQQIEQQKDQAQKDYTREQSGAYADWQKQSNEFGAEAEQRAAQGLENTGFSESSKVRMYTDYQNRSVAAREGFNKAVLNFNNSITQARLQNNSALAEIAYKSLQQQLELSLQGFQYKNTLLLDQANKKLELDQIFHQRWQDVLDQMNTENALAEEIRQFNEQMAEDRRQFDRLHPEVVASSGGGGGGGGDGGSDSGSPKPRIKDDNPGYNKNQYNEAEKVLNQAIAEGASKDKIANAISLAERNGVVTKPQANLLRETYTPRGLQY